MKIEFKKDSYMITLYNFRKDYCNLICDLVISDGNVICDFYAKENLVEFYDDEKFCIIEMPGRFKDYSAILVPEEFYSSLVDVKEKLVVYFYDEFLVDPNIL